MPTPAAGWPVVEGQIVGTVLGPFLGLDGPKFEKPWYVLDLATQLPEDFDPFYTQRQPGASAPPSRR